MEFIFIFYYFASPITTQHAMPRCCGCDDDGRRRPMQPTAALLVDTRNTIGGSLENSHDAPREKNRFFPFFPRPFSEWLLASGFSFFFFFLLQVLLSSGDGRVAGEKSNIAPPLPLPPPPPPLHWHLPPRRADACCGLSIPLPLFRSSLCSARTASHNHNQQLRRESVLYTVYNNSIDVLPP